MTPRAAQYLVLVALFAAVGLTPPASAAGSQPTRYAAPHGTGTACTKQQPCSITTAVNHSRGGAVVINPGTYGSAAKPITTSLHDLSAKHPLHIFGRVSAPFPVIYDSAGPAFDLENNSSLSHIELISSGAHGAGLFMLGGIASAVQVRSSGGSSPACSVWGTLTDSLCVAAGDNQPAIAYQAAGHQHITLRGVTAEAKGTGGVGLLDSTGDAGSKVSITVTNSIIHGAGTDVSAQTSSAGSTAAVVLTHSDYRTTAKSGSGSSSVTGNATDIKGTPKFENAANSDFRERTGSATIDAGAPDRAGDTDLVGNRRTLGPAPDMGAYEFLERPTASKLRVGKLTPGIAHLSVSVNPEGLKTLVKLVATHGAERVTSTLQPAHKGRKPVTIHLALHGLKPHTTYAVHAVATNRAGSTNSAHRQVHTP